MYTRLCVVMLLGCSALTLAHAAGRGSPAPAASSHSYTPSYSPSHSSSPIHSSPYPYSSSPSSRSPFSSSGAPRIPVPPNSNLPSPGLVTPWLTTSPHAASATRDAPNQAGASQGEHRDSAGRPGLFTSHFLHQDHGEDWHADRLAAPLAWQRHHHAAFVAWIGPLFWPYVYTDLFYYPFWPAAYDDEYWPYVYDDFFDSIYWADLNADPSYAEPTADAIVLEQESSRGKRQAGIQDADVCGSDGGVITWPFDELESVLQLTAEQQALLDVLKTVAAQTAGFLKGLCPHEAPLTPTGRLDAMLARLQAALNASHAIHAPLMTFYGSLSDEQKVRFNAIVPDARPNGGTGPADATCPEDAPALADIPIQRIAGGVVPSDDGQRIKLGELAKADRHAIAILQAACPGRLPRTPVDRLEAIETRLAAMIAAAKAIQPALQSFYGSLTAEQKSRFNMLTRAASADDRSLCGTMTGEEAIAACSHLLVLNPKNAPAYNSRGIVYANKHDYDRANAQQGDAGALYEKAAELLRAGRFSEAMPLAQRALAIWEKALGPGHPDFAIALNNLAVLYYQQARYADAEPLFKRALAILEKAFGPDYRDVALLLNNLADLYRAQGRDADAEPLYKRALSIRERSLGPDSR
jgi:tetratricopeptide (TPR) repeat protein